MEPNDASAASLFNHSSLSAAKTKRQVEFPELQHQAMIITQPVCHSGEVEGGGHRNVNQGKNESYGSNAANGGFRWPPKKIHKRTTVAVAMADHEKRRGSLPMAAIGTPLLA
jgi:hypothetical protein